jgi:hypothetical protein
VVFGGGVFRFVSPPLSVDGAACANWADADCAWDGVVVNDATVRADVASSTRRKLVMTTFLYPNKKFRQQTRGLLADGDGVPIN